MYITNVRSQHQKLQMLWYQNKNELDAVHKNSYLSGNSNFECV